MRLVSALVLCTLIAAPTMAQASMRLHLPHKRRHHDREPAAGADAPTTDVPPAIWSGGARR